VAGIEIGLNWSWLAIVALIVASLLELRTLTAPRPSPASSGG
jgi:hypothetical protein